MFKDDAGNVVLTTNSLANASMTQIPLYGIELMGFEYDANAGTSAVVTVFGQVGGHLAIGTN